MPFWVLALQLENTLVSLQWSTYRKWHLAGVANDIWFYGGVSGWASGVDIQEEQGVYTPPFRKIRN